MGERSPTSMQGKPSTVPAPVVPRRATTPPTTSWIPVSRSDAAAGAAITAALIAGPMWPSLGFVGFTLAMIFLAAYGLCVALATAAILRDWAPTTPTAAPASVPDVLADLGLPTQTHPTTRAHRL